EDGIRDFHVTGVQTCALPISEGEKPTPREAVVSLELPSGSYRAEWVNPLTGKVDKREAVKSKKNLVTLTSPPYREDIAIKLIRKIGRASCRDRAQNAVGEGAA